MPWDPAQYHRFATERAQPFHDLCDLVQPDGPVHRAVDLGCGTGELTVAVAERFGIAETIGVDSSPEMLAVARQIEARPIAAGRVTFVAGDLADWTAGAIRPEWATGVDLVLANASLHWVPDHATVLARWADSLAPGGWLAVQVPANAGHPSHLASAAVAHTEPFRSAFDGDPPSDPVAANVLAPARYASILHGLGLTDVHARLQVYLHELPDSATVVDWTRGTSLTRFFDRLPVGLHEAFVDAYRSELLERIGHHAPYLFTFDRILLRARRPGPGPSPG
ncbi:MAG: methyltransferase domain-containing protein [Ilumatobacteraceae bacterium]